MDLWSGGAFVFTLLKAFTLNIPALHAQDQCKTYSRG